MGRKSGYLATAFVVCVCAFAMVGCGKDEEGGVNETTTPAPAITAAGGVADKTSSSSSTTPVPATTPNSTGLKLNIENIK